MHNPHSGHLAAGFRFRFKARALFHKTLFLPLEMKQLDQIKLLVEGESPLKVFNCDSIQEARNAFDELRKKFDFPFWALKEFYIRVNGIPRQIVTLSLNSLQNKLINILLQRYFNRKKAKYVIYKTFGPVGLTTCIQAYIIWRQAYHYPKNSFTASLSQFSEDPVWEGHRRFLLSDNASCDRYFDFPMSDAKAYFDHYRLLHYNERTTELKSLDLAYIHQANMSSWPDKDAYYTPKVVKIDYERRLDNYYNLVVHEGNVPTPDRFDIKKHQDTDKDWNRRLGDLSGLGNNPRFLNDVAFANIPDYDYDLLPIDLDKLQEEHPPR